ncbi:MAG TPA: hypothetical protein VGU25_09220 [Acidobacteriaceae bacterium]|nr:hypothetical protein [Acidobacteriaceae bacterium]
MQSAHKKNTSTAIRAQLTLVPRAPREHTQRRSPLALWHLLSLDAPSVACVWTIAVASAVGLHLPWTSPAAMFVAVWILYVADRLLDARSLDTHHAPHDLEARHIFHHRHRRAFLAGILISACLLSALLRTLDTHALRLYVLLATLLAAYFLLIHARPDTAHRLPKELAVGIFFPAAVFIPTVARLPQLRLDLLPIAILLAATCSLNCLFLYAWEHPGPRTHAHSSTRWATRHLVPLTCTIAALSLVYCLRSSALLSAPRSLIACILASSLLLLALHYLRRRLQPIHLRALADLVLLTPLIPLALSHLKR